MSENKKIPFLIAATDYLFSIVPNYGAFNPAQKIIGFEYNEDKIEYSNIEKATASMNNFNDVAAYAASEGYIQRPPNNHSTFMYELTDLGRDIKTAGSIERYYELKKNTNEAVFKNLIFAERAAQASERSATAAENATSYTKITKNWIIAYTIITFFILIVSAVTCYYTTRSQTNTTIKASSTTDIPAKHITDTIK